MSQYRIPSVETSPRTNDLDQPRTSEEAEGSQTASPVTNSPPSSCQQIPTQPQKPMTRRAQPKRAIVEETLASQLEIEKEKKAEEKRIADEKKSAEEKKQLEAIQKV